MTVPDSQSKFGTSSTLVSRPGEPFFYEGKKCFKPLTFNATMLTDMAITDKCRHGHVWREKTTRWILVKGFMRRKCRVCEAAGFRLKYQTNHEFRATKQVNNLKYYREKVAPKHAVQEI